MLSKRDIIEQENDIINLKLLRELIWKKSCINF